MTVAWPMLRSRSFALAAANLVVACFVLWPWLPERARPARVPAAPNQPDAPALASLPPLTHFAATAERPLFAPSRRPAAAAVSRGAGAIESRYRLLGLVIAGNTRRALVADIAGGRRFEIGEGEAIEGWVVKRIERNAVVLASPSGETTLTLRSADGAGPATKP